MTRQIGTIRKYELTEEDLEHVKSLSEFLGIFINTTAEVITCVTDTYQKGPLEKDVPRLFRECGWGKDHEIPVETFTSELAFSKVKSDAMLDNYSTSLKIKAIFEEIGKSTYGSDNFDDMDDDIIDGYSKAVFYWGQNDCGYCAICQNNCFYVDSDYPDDMRRLIDLYERIRDEVGLEKFFRLVTIY